MPGEAQRQAGVRDLASATNALVKVFRRSLADGTTREGWVATEGPHILEEAVKSNSRASVRSVLASQTASVRHRDLLAQLPPETEIARVPDRLFRQLSQTPAPQGIAVLVELQPPDLESVLSRPDLILVVACGLQDPGNLGTIIRSSDALGASGIATLANTVSPFNPKAVRSCAGSILRLPVFANLQPGSLFNLLRARHVQIVAADAHSSQAVSGADLRGPVAILIGKEAAGLPPEILREAGPLLRIPIRSEADSINAATAAGVFLYEIARQRGFPYSS